MAATDNFLLRRIKGDVLSFIMMLLCAAPLVISAMMTTNGYFNTFHIFGYSVELKEVCFFRLFTGYNCPVCGMTRTFTYMTHGNISEALQMNKAGIPLYFLCIYEVIYRFAVLMLGRFKLYKFFKIVEIVFVTFVCVAVTVVFLKQFFI